MVLQFVHEVTFSIIGNLTEKKLPQLFIKQNNIKQKLVRFSKLEISDVSTAIKLS
jgi:hypothetical protein